MNIYWNGRVMQYLNSPLNCACGGGSHMHEWSSVLNKINVNDAYNEFMQAFVRIYAHFPFTAFKLSKKTRKP